MLSADELQEKDFIHEGLKKNPFPFFAGFFIVIAISSLVVGATLIFYSVLNIQYTKHPFLRVTNRELSIFLWQDPSHMRIHAKNKNGYLPAFHYAEKIGLSPEYADSYAIAPPALLFLYHTWHRLLGNHYTPRSIPSSEFKTFLASSPEWLPEYWKKAPEEYIAFIETFQQYEDQDLSSIDGKSLPLQVRQAFTGWKNYFFEGGKINELEITHKMVEDFLAAYPNFARNYWSNLIGDSYLNLSMGSSDSIVSKESLSPFLLVSLYNWLQQNHSKRAQNPSS